VPALFVLSYAYWPFSIQSTVHSLHFVLWLVILVGFVALALYDSRWYLLPNKIIFPLQAIAAVFALTSLIIFPDTYSVFQLVLGLAFSAGLFWVLHAVSDGKWIGYGDVKLAVVLGLVLGKLELALLMLFIASAAGTLV